MKDENSDLKVNTCIRVIFVMMFSNESDSILVSKADHEPTGT